MASAYKKGQVQVLQNRKHSNIQCNCRQCKQFDYSDTDALPLLGQPPFAAVELIRAIDSETWERHDHYIPSRKPRPYNKYQL